MVSRLDTWVARAAPWGAVAAAGLAFAAIGAGWAGGGGSVVLPWVPSWGLTLAFTLDGLAALYALLATGVGLVVTIYSTAYIPAHLRHQGRAPAEQTRFYGLLLLFIAAMTGMALAADLVLLVLCFDVTAVASYFLIGYDRENPEARRAALMALIVTGGTSVALLAAAVLLGAAAGTFAIPRLLADPPAGPAGTAAALLILLAAAAKSAQVPLHFWLPRAMVAPTPVSAYLHSAAMVAAGVFLLTRLYPLLVAAPGLRSAMLALGLASMLVGGLLALTRDVLKQLLAYSTIAQYGYVLTMLGLGGEHAVPAACFYVLAHGAIKSALFLAAGAVTMATGEDRLSRLGGLGGRMRLLAAGTAVAAAGLAGLPLTLGFFKDEVLFTTALERGPGWAGAVVAGAALSFAYAWRFWGGLFLGPRPVEPEPVPRLTAPVAVLALAVLAGGFAAAPFGRLATAAGQAVVPDAASLDLAYHWAPRIEYLLAALAWGCGALIAKTRGGWTPALALLARLGDRAGPARGYEAGAGWLARLSRLTARAEPRDVRGRVLSVLAPGGVLVVIAAAAAWDVRTLRAGDFSAADVPLAASLLFAAGAALVAAFTRGPLTLMLATSLVSLGLVAVFALRGAPDVALVGVAVGTALTLLLLTGLRLFPSRLLRVPPGRLHPWPRRELLTAAITAAFSFAIVWDALSRPLGRLVAARQVALTPAAHGRDVVTTILADFRGLDTLGECTVIVIVLLGIVSLARTGERT